MKNRLSKKLATLAANCRAVQIEALQARPALVPHLLGCLEYARQQLDEAAILAKPHRCAGTRPRGITSGVAVAKKKKGAK